MCVKDDKKVRAYTLRLCVCVCVCGGFFCVYVVLLVKIRDGFYPSHVSTSVPLVVTYPQ